MAKKDEISDEEQALFREAMHGVKKITPKKTIAPLPPRITRPKRATPDTNSSHATYSDYDKVEPVSGEDMIEYRKSGFQHKNLRKLRLGQYNVEAILDLHGMTVVEAKEALHHFLKQCLRKGTRHVLIIHGKGRSDTYPILKNKLNNWLRQIDQIVAFCSAAAKDGRSGAMYVLLKNQKGE
jgi:DNA-nicking Smr family endonuclease